MRSRLRLLLANRGRGYRLGLRANDRPADSQERQPALDRALERARNLGHEVRKLLLDLGRRGPRRVARRPNDNGPLTLDCIRGHPRRTLGSGAEKKTWAA